MQPTDLLIAAEDLVSVHKGKPRQASLKRAASTVYYALFHTLCSTCACAITTRGTKRAWVQAYRAVNHGAAASACRRVAAMSGFPTAVIDFAGLFVQLQDKRYSADYDPAYRIAKSEVETDIEAARIVIAGFNAAPNRHKRAFSAMVLFGKR